MSYPLSPQSDAKLVQVVPSFCLKGDIRDAVELYRETFPGAVVEKQLILDNGQLLVAEIGLKGSTVNLLAGGSQFELNETFSLLVNFDPSLLDDAEAELDRAWEVLSRDGRVLMAKGEYPHSPLYGWVADKFGVHWQLMLTNPQGTLAPFITPCLLFADQQHPQAFECREHYNSVFTSVPGAENTRLGALVMANPEAPHSVGETVLFTQLTLAGTEISMMDTGVPTECEFASGGSLLAKCPDQAAIDAVWTLSADPEREICGWLVDRFGFNWQVAPTDIDELLARDGAMERMRAMKKIDIAALRGDGGQ